MLLHLGLKEIPVHLCDRDGRFQDDYYDPVVLSVTFANPGSPQSILWLRVRVFGRFVHQWFKQHLSCDGVLEESVGLGR